MVSKRILFKKKMKKIVYTVAFLLAITWVEANAQTRIKESNKEIADLVLFQDKLLIYTQKDPDGQYLYTERKGQGGTPQKDIALNAGIINSLIGANQATGEVYVYQKAGRNEEKLAVYRWEGESFSKTEERPLPRMRNQSYNLGMFLTEEKDALYISAELGRSKGYDDLYVSRWENGRWTKPRNLGSAVNTRDMEFAPHVANDSLYFSRKQGDQAYVYAVALGPGSSEPVRVKGQINQEESFSAYYKQVDEQDLWISRAPGNTPYIAYLSGKEEAEPVLAGVEIDEPVMVAKEEVKPAQPAAKFNLASPDQRFFFDLDVTFLSKADVAVMEQFLGQQPAGSALLIKGYSDKIGSDQAKQSVSQKRATNLKWYIDRYHADRQFTVEVQHEVLQEKGRNQRKTEIFVAK